MSGARGAPAHMPTLLGLAFYTFFLQTLPGMVAPYLAAEFGLDDSQITFLTGTMGLGSFGTYLLARAADRRGRRSALVGCAAGLPVLCAATAFAFGPVVYALVQIPAVALHGTLHAILGVVIAEEAVEGGRAKAQAWFALCGSFGGGLALYLLSAVGAAPSGWRYAYGLGAVPVLLLPWLLPRLPETSRYRRAEERGRAAASRARDLLAGAYRRRAIGMLCASTLRTMVLIGVGSWTYYHAVRTLAIDPLETAVMFTLGGGLGMVGLPIGVRLTERWGRRPALVSATLLLAVAGVGYYWIPAGRGGVTLVLLGVTFGLFNLGSQALGVADRCLNAEAFPTWLRATYAGFVSLAGAAAGIGSQYALSGLALLFGGLPVAITLLCAVTAVPSLVFFLAAAPETRGLTLEVASLEDRVEGAET